MLFSFDTPYVLGRFIDGIMAIPDMKGVTITIPGDEKPCEFNESSVRAIVLLQRVLDEGFLLDDSDLKKEIQQFLI
jgi:hypothetical protein